MRSKFGYEIDYQPPPSARTGSVYKPPEPLIGTIGDFPQGWLHAAECVSLLNISSIAGQSSVCSEAGGASRGGPVELEGHREYDDDMSDALREVRCAALCSPCSFGLKRSLVSLVSNAYKLCFGGFFWSVCFFALLRYFDVLFSLILFCTFFVCCLWAPARAHMSVLIFNHPTYAYPYILRLYT